MGERCIRRQLQCFAVTRFCSFRLAEKSVDVAEIDMHLGQFGTELERSQQVVLGGSMPAQLRISDANLVMRLDIFRISGKDALEESASIFGTGVLLMLQDARRRCIAGTPR